MKVSSALTSIKLLVFILLFFCSIQTVHLEKSKVIDLEDGEEYVLSGSQLFCYQNNIESTWMESWTRIQVKVWSSDWFRVKIVDEEDHQQEVESFVLWRWFQRCLNEQHKEASIGISLSNKKTCFRIDPSTNGHYTLKPLWHFDVPLFLVFLYGILLLVFADSLTRSQIFFYFAGISTGLTFSVIILVFILTRFIPKKVPFYFLIAGSWSFSVYVVQLLLKNIQTILREHWAWVQGYIAVVGFISFAVCYHHGPLTEEKTKDIMSWALQLLGLFLIYFGCQIPQVAYAVMVAALFAKNLECLASSVFRTLVKFTQLVFCKPECGGLLTWGQVETLPAFEEQRKCCTGPLYSPKRFACFAESSRTMCNEPSNEHYFNLEDDSFFTEDEED